MQIEQGQVSDDEQDSGGKLGAGELLDAVGEREDAGMSEGDSDLQLLQ